MTDLFINDIQADLYDDFTLDMEYENEFFSNASEYSLDIELPLEGSPNNQKIFGHINRVTVPKVDVDLQVAAYVNGRSVAYGRAVVIDITDKSVTIQILGNTSEFNNYADTVYIDKLELGNAVAPKPSDKFFELVGGRDELQEADYHCFFGSVDDTDMVFFWAFNRNPTTKAEYYPVFSNIYPISIFPMASSVSGGCVYIDGFDRYSCQPYLLRVIERVMMAIGYKIRRNDINHHWLRNLYICNYVSKYWTTNCDATRPDPDDTTVGYGRPMTSALPHWRLSTFIDEVEKLCACVFLFNSHNKTVDIVMLNRFYDESVLQTKIDDDKVIDEYCVDVQQSDDGKDLADGNISFNKSYVDKYLKVDREVLASISQTKHYDNFDALQAGYDQMGVKQRNVVLFVDDSTGRQYINYTADGKSALKETNVFGELFRGEDKPNVELNIVPANTVRFGVGWWLSQNQQHPTVGVDLNVPFTEQQEEQANASTAQEIIESNTATNEESEDKSCIEVMLSTGENHLRTAYQGKELRYPAPFTDFNMDAVPKDTFPKMSLSLKDVCEQSLGHLYRSIPNYQSDKTYIIKFVSSSLPDVRGIFLIHNQRYVCRKLSVTYDDGDTFIFEGEFYRIDN